MKSKWILGYGIMFIMLILFLGYETWQLYFSWMQRFMGLHLDHITVSIGMKFIFIVILTLSYWAMMSFVLFFTSKWVNKRIQR